MSYLHTLVKLPSSYTSSKPIRAPRITDLYDTLTVKSLCRIPKTMLHYDRKHNETIGQALLYACTHPINVVSRSGILYNNGVTKTLVQLTPTLWTIKDYSQDTLKLTLKNGQLEHFVSEILTLRDPTEIILTY